MGLSALKSYLPFTSKRAVVNEARDSDGYLPGKFTLDRLKIGSKITGAVCLAWASYATLSRFCNPVGPCDAEHFGRMSAAGFEVLMSSFTTCSTVFLASLTGFIIHSEKNAVEEANIQRFLYEEKPSMALSNEILKSSSAVEKILEQAKIDPKILDKKVGLFGNTLLKEFYDEIVWENDSFRPGLQTSSVPLRYQLQAQRNQKILKMLLLAAPWPKEELFECLHSTNRGTLASWPEVREKIAKRDDLTLEERVDLESLFRTGKV